jgi:hypothetical protein
MESAVLLDQSNFVFNETKFKELEKRNIEMEASIRYAGNLQQSILPNERLFKKLLRGRLCDVSTKRYCLWRFLLVLSTQ